MSKRMINPSTGRGRVALVTGSASSVGIGAAMCRVFAREGAKVVVSDLPSREKDGLERVKELNDAYGDNTAIWVPLHVTKAEEWQKAIATIEAHFGPLDVLCNNAGISGKIQGGQAMQTLDQLDIDDFINIMDVNSTGVALGMIEAAKSMKKNGVAEWKSIINTSSVAGMQGGGGVPLGYTGSKWCVRGMTKAGAAFGAPLKIRVNSIHPGLIRSEMTQGANWLGEDLQVNNVGTQLQQNTPMGRFGEPEEVANMVLLLASPEGSYLNGQAFIIDGALYKA